MSQVDVLEILVDIGEDFTAQVFWTDEDGSAVPITVPCRLEARDANGVLALQLDSGSDPAAKPAITITGSQGLMQLSIPSTYTKQLTAGRYLFDLWATASSGIQPFPTQMQKVASGFVLATDRVTIMEVGAV